MTRVCLDVPDLMMATTEHCHSDSTQSYPSSGSPTGCRPLPQARVPSLLYARPTMTPARGSETTSRMTQIHRTPMILMCLMSTPSPLSLELGCQKQKRVYMRVGHVRTANTRILLHITVFSYLFWAQMDTS